MLKNEQRLSLHQKLSPQAIQAQLLLTVPALELEEEIKNQLEQNPLLEEDSSQETSEVQSESQPEVEKLIGELQSAYNDNMPHYSHRSDNSDYIAKTYTKTYDSPMDQFYRLGLNETDELIGTEIIGSLDNDGYLRINIEDLVADLNTKYSLGITTADVERVLKIINKLEPLGLGARDIKDCLVIQLEEMAIEPEIKELCIKMICSHFEDFTHKHFEKLIKELGVSKEKLNEMFDVIQKLNPHPGLNEIVSETEYIYPDFIVTKADGKWEVELTRDSTVKIKISPKYLEMYDSKDTPTDTREFIKNKLESARWFLNAVRSRKETMLKVMKAIVEKQTEFFDTNGEVLKPMFEKDIAEEINMDVSTVSRVVRGKYVQTDFGIFELKYFFSSAYRTETGEDISNKMVKEKIREIIENEDKSKPLSDDHVTDLMKRNGFNIARRTVAKYREAMRIPKATLRRKIVL
ncbi:MAG TPA: RNA polymerase factor sigma-54 [Ignavibacteria bacterium]|jgi:RNA polymerase sigma-54 factor